MKIASHNAFWFQGAPFAPDRPGPAAANVLDRLIEIYRDLGPDLLCLQEIQNGETFGQVTQALGMCGAYCPGGAAAQYGGAVLWKAGRVAADSRGATQPVQRMWQIAEVPLADGTVVRAANVHLPSGRQLGAQAATCARSEEMAAVLDRAQPPEVVLGDFNEQPGGPLGEILGARGYVDAAVLAGKAELGTTGPVPRRQDQIWLSQSVRDTFVGYGVVPEAAMQTALPGNTLLSDHFPVWVELALRR